MQIWEFVRELACFFPLTGSEEHQNKIFDSYVENLEGICIKNKCDYDWKKVLNAIQCTYTYSKFPPLADIIKCLPECKVFKPYIESKDEGALLVVTLPDDRFYDFTICGIGKHLETVKDEIRIKFGDCKVESYPKGTVRIGNDFILP